METISYNAVFDLKNNPSKINEWTYLSLKELCLSSLEEFASFLRSCRISSSSSFIFSCTFFPF